MDLSPVGMFRSGRFLSLLPCVLQCNIEPISERHRAWWEARPLGEGRHLASLTAEHPAEGLDLAWRGIEGGSERIGSSSCCCVERPTNAPGSRYIRGLPGAT